MPIREYLCLSCSERFEEIIGNGKVVPEFRTCPSCGLTNAQLQTSAPVMRTKLADFDKHPFHGTALDGCSGDELRYTSDKPFVDLKKGDRVRHKKKNPIKSTLGIPE